MTPWSEKEIQRYLAREGMFRRRGLSPADSEKLAERCVSRDRDADDRRACIECKNLQRGFACLAKQVVGPITIFQRCHRFEWMVPKATKEAQ